MKKILIIGFICKFLIPFAYSQTEDHVKGGWFTKTVEYNLRMLEDLYNFNSKGEVEKLFFGDFNAPVEFFYNPSFEEASGFRIVKDTVKMSYILEIKYVSNYEEIASEMEKKYPLIGDRGDLSKVVSDEKTVGELIRNYNRNNINKKFEESLKLFKVESRSFPICKRFAEEMYKVMVSVIENFKAKGVPPIFNDGYEVTFRNVVEDEVWSLKIHIPTGTSLKLANLCRKIITETLATGMVDESSYIKLLDDFN